MLEAEQLIVKIYNAFSPFVPLPAGNPVYVNCSAVWGEENVYRELGKKIISVNSPPYLLYGSHRGTGQSTGLLHLQRDLQQHGCMVIYFDTDEKDIDPQDVESTDILLACTHNVLHSLHKAVPSETLDGFVEIERKWVEITLFCSFIQAR
ncbi:MAG: hypothetical protein AAGG51_23990 [Cyanobacteria bacterium P01_G01_bin.54]